MIGTTQVHNANIAVVRMSAVNNVPKCMSHSILGRHSGKGAIFSKLKALGIVVNKDLEDAAYERFMEVAVTKKEVTRDDLLEIAKSLNLT